ncbi:MAG: endonuclease/exonuclease/phosphatase family protein, partial [Muribaculaceae bacterium]|nr:endonuclease/exonuclease/phosphatase family protein [Muribaculaceae bacterium]
VLASVSANATQIIVGSYNIRVQTPNDKGANNWDNRRDYVARTVVDNGFDVVGFNEVKSERQKTELMERLPQYSFSGWDGHEGWASVSETAVDLIGYRTDKFDLLDEGWYFLSRNLREWECSWDNSSEANVRHTSWAKLRVKGTEEVFFVFCTHLDHQGNIARMLQAHLNYEKMWEIAGHYPTVMVGDQNSTISRVNYLNLYNAGFTDAFSIVPNPEERFGKADPATAGQWNADPTAGRRIDYIWVRGFNVDSYDHCTDKYDLGAMPSDHIAITAKLTYVDPDINNRYRYVKAGSAGTGSKESPFGTLQEAVDAAGLGDTIYVAAGEYEIASTVNISRSVRIFGGYDEDFQDVAGLSEIKAIAPVRCVMLKKNTDVELRNFAVRNGTVTADNQDGAGICAHGSRLVLRRCELSDNTVSRDGGAIDCTGQLILDHVRFLRNKAGRNGGGVCCDNPNKRYWFNFPVENCYFEENEAADGSALYLPRFVYGYVSGNTFAANRATDGSTTVLHAVSNASTSKLGVNLTVVNNTWVLNETAGASGASALKVEIDADAPFALANNTVVSNRSANGVHAVCMTQGTPYISNNIVACNEGGDVMLDVDGVSASFNLYTCAEALTYPLNTARDIYSEDYASSVSALARVLDGEIVEGRFIPALTTETPDADGGIGARAADDGSDWQVPSVKVVSPVYSDNMNLCTVTAMRLREDMLRADFNNDCMKEKSVSLAVDQIGVPRPLDGKSTIGAREYVAPAGIEGIVTDGYSGVDADAPVEYFDLQGRRVAAPVSGIYVRRQGARVDKVAVR